jgi:23S rRNA U2552 (ribose-2'-O)-methylase RlmE/FtsJ
MDTTKNIFVPLGNMPLPPFITVELGWQETQHKKITDTKDQITIFNNTDEWELRKRLANPYELIYSTDDSFPSVAKINALSRSYFKMAEMLNLLDFFSSVKGPLKTAHACEGPGGFIQYMVERAKQKKIPIQSVSAITLKPTRSFIPGWRRSFHFLRKHPEIQLEYGLDDTGDILNPINQKDFCKKVNNCMLYTADGGFDFSIDYNKQEQNVFQLIVASFILGLKTLAENGCMIIKIFDMYSPATQDLILGSASCFKEFTLFKPLTSRPCNSERYFIGKGFLKTKQTAEWISNLQDVYEKHYTTSFTRFTRFFINPWPKALQHLLNEQIEWQETLQIQSIYNTLNLNKNKIPELLERNLDLCKKWCRENNIDTIYQEPA